MTEYGCPDCGVNHRPEDCDVPVVDNLRAEMKLQQEALEDLSRMLQFWQEKYRKVVPSWEYEQALEQQRAFDRYA